MSAESLVAPAAVSPPRLSRSTREAALHVLAGLVLVVLSVSSFAVSTGFGIAVSFVATLALSIVLPASMPVVIVSAFLYQNAAVAWFTPYISDNTAFDAMRGANFVVLMTAYGAFLCASLGRRGLAVPGLKPWVVRAIGLSAVIVLYLGIGAVRGEPRDALVYFRNTVTPIACFHVALVAASLYPVELKRSLAWLAAGAIAYGYCELTFTMDFLSLFHGDEYVLRDIRRQVESGVWEKLLQQTGFVLRSLMDVMRTDFFNTPFFGDIFPEVFRIGGPNFHPISYAYALSILSVWLLFKGSKLLPLLALPLMVVIGSKGATILLLTALLVAALMPRLGVRPTLALVVGLSIAWVGAAITYGVGHGDYHVLGLFAGLREFLHDPFGQGLGIGGNLSTTSVSVNWDRAQEVGAAAVPVESAIGVMLYQVGIGSLAFFAMLAALAAAAARLLQRTGEREFLFAFVAIITLAANAVLQEEAFFSPLALGLCLLLVGTAFGGHFRRAYASASARNAARPA